jgi:hypothetical protein
MLSARKRASRKYDLIKDCGLTPEEADLFLIENPKPFTTCTRAPAISAFRERRRLEAERQLHARTARRSLVNELRVNHNRPVVPPDTPIVVLHEDECEEQHVVITENLGESEAELQSPTFQVTFEHGTIHVSASATPDHPLSSPAWIEVTDSSLGRYIQSRDTGERWRLDKQERLEMMAPNVFLVRTNAVFFTVLPDANEDAKKLWQDRVISSHSIVNSVPLTPGGTGVISTPLSHKQLRQFHRQTRINLTLVKKHREKLDAEALEMEAEIFLAERELAKNLSQPHGGVQND